jgi:hypothetical protein
MRISVVLGVVCVMALLSSPGMAVELTVSRASSLEAAPAGKVDRAEMAPLDGVPVATGDEPIFTHFTRQKRRDPEPSPSKIPIPQANPASVSFCTVETL